MKDKDNKNLQRGSPVWMTIKACTGNGTIVKINKRTCHVQCGFDLYKRVKPQELELTQQKRRNHQG